MNVKEKNILFNYWLMFRFSQHNIFVIKSNQDN